MAKLQDKLYNRIIEGKLNLSEEEISDLNIPTQEDIEAIIRQSAPFIIFSEDDIDAITDVDFNELHIGDIIYSESDAVLAYVYSNSRYYCYIRTLPVIDNNTITYSEISYEYSEGEWSFYEREDKSVAGGTKLYKHAITISRTGGAPYIMYLVTTKGEQLSMDSDIGQLIHGEYSSENGFYRCSKPSKPFPSATILSFSYESSVTIEGNNCIVVNDVTVTPTEISDTVTPL